MAKWSQKALDSCMKYWQKILGLSHWDIVITYANNRDIEYLLGYPASASISSSPSMERAIIRINSTPELDEDAIIYGSDDVEWSILHELLHLYYIDLSINKEDKVQGELIERIINKTCKALLTTGRFRNGSSSR
jgi:hypothetical protein